MAFQIKDFVSIVASQINHARSVTDKITDFLPGSVARTLVEAPAVEMEELYMQMFLGLRDAIPVATFLSFDFDKLPASVAHGWVNISTDPPPDADVLIPAGTTFTARDGRIYTSTQDVTWPAGDNVVRVPVAYATAGLAGNIAGGMIDSSPLFGADYTISNGAIETGRDAETAEEREARFAAFVASLSRGTVVACEYAVRSAKVLDQDGNLYEYVTRAGMSEAPGHVRFFVYSNRGSASDALLNAGQQIIDGWVDETTGVKVPGYRSAGVRVDVLRMVERSVTMSVSVEMFPGYALNDDVRRRLTDIYGTAVRGVQPGATLYIGTLVEMMLVVPGVRQIVPASKANIECGMHEALVPGVLTIGPL